MTGYPLAVAPSVKTPGAYILVNLLAGESSPGNGALKALLIGVKTSTGTLATDTLKTGVAGFSELRTLTGDGPVALAGKRLFEEYGIASADLILPPEPATVAATGTFTFAGTPTVAWTYTLRIAGREYQGTWAAGTTHIVFATSLTTLINGKTAELPCSATDNGAGVLTIAFKTKGTLGNDVIIEFEMTGGTTGTVDAGTVKVTKNLTSGTGEMDPAASLAIVAGTEYAFIVPMIGNTGNNTSGSTTAAAKIQTHVDAYDSGANAKLQQVVLAMTSTYAASITAAGYRNHGPTELTLFQGARSLPGEMAAAEAGARMREESIDPAVNRIGQVYQATLYGPIDPVASALTDAQVESALAGGVTPIKQAANGDISPVRPITTYHVDTASNPDDRLLDVSRVSGTYAVARDLRGALPQKFPRKKLIRNLPAGSDPPGASTVQEKTVKTYVVGRVGGYWGGTREVVNKDAFDAAVADGSFICRVNDTDSSQLDLVIPMKVVPPLAKFSVVVNHVGP